MAEDKAKPTLGPWELNLVSIGNEISHSIAETMFPYKNGAELEDMGVNPEIFKFSCVLLNDDFDNNYYQLRQWFLSIFPEPIELFHPEHGTLYGYPKNVSFSNDRRLRYAEFTFDFEIAGVQADTQSYTDPYDANFEEAQALNLEVQESVAVSMQQAGVPDIEGSSDWSLIDVWASLGDEARAYGEATNQAISKLLGVIESVKAPVDAINSTIDYADSLSGTLTKAIQECCDSFVTLARKSGSSKGKSRASTATLVASVSSMLTSLYGAPESVCAAFATIAAATIATETAKAITDDEKKMGESISVESGAVDDAEGRELATESEPYFLTPEDLEETLALAREFIQQVLPQATSPYRLKKMAAMLSDAVRRIKIEFMTTKAVYVNNETPLHKIALDNGLNYKAADRLCALNNVKNPTFMKGEVLVYES